MVQSGTVDIRLAAERVAGLRAIPPERFIGWREVAKAAVGGVIGATGLEVSALRR
jgi:hypothetical protein